MSSSRPSWMEGGTKRPKAPPPQRLQPSPSTPPPERIVIEVPDAPTTHRNVVIGVTILTLLTLFSVFFWVGIWIAGVVNPPEAGYVLFEGPGVVTLGDYLSFGRTALGVVAGVIGTLVTWEIVDNMVD